MDLSKLPFSVLATVLNFLTRPTINHLSTISRAWYKIIYQYRGHWDIVKNIVLIGSTGTGKSRLGNFLYDPYFYETSQVFPCHTDNLPQTNEVAIADTFYNGIRIGIVDTPGLNESPKKDAHNAINLVRVLRDRIVVLNAVILCFKLENIIDEQFRSTVKYYASLFKDCLSANFLVVVTNVPTSTVARRKWIRANFDLEKSLRNITTEIQSMMHLTYTPCVITIDSFPLRDEEEEYQPSLFNRKLIFDTVCTFHSVSLTELKVFKTPWMRSVDIPLVEKFSNEIYNLKSQLTKIKHDGEKELIKYGNIRDKLKIALKKKETCKKELGHADEEIQVDCWNWIGSSSWTWVEKSFNLDNIKWPICRVTKNLTGGEWKEFQVESSRVSGRIVGNWFQGVQANVVVYSKIRDRFSEVMKGNVVNLALCQELIDSYQETLERHRVKKEKRGDERIEIEDLIETTQSILDTILSEYISVEDGLLFYIKRWFPD